MTSRPCYQCGAAIVLAGRPGGGKIALDAEPHPRGDWAVDEKDCTGPEDGHGTLDLSVRYTAHYTTCTGRVANQLKINYG